MAPVIVGETPRVGGGQGRSLGHGRGGIIPRNWQTARFADFPPLP